MILIRKPRFRLPNGVVITGDAVLIDGADDLVSLATEIENGKRVLTVALTEAKTEGPKVAQKKKRATKKSKRKVAREGASNAGGD